MREAPTARGPGLGGHAPAPASFRARAGRGSFEAEIQPEEVIAVVEQSVPVVTLESLADGAAAELFASELRKVLANIQDPNTEASATRKVTLEVSFQPDEEREVGEVKIRATSKLAGLKGAKTRVFFGRHRGELVATEYNPKQAGLFDERPALRDVAGKKGER